MATEKLNLVSRQLQLWGARYTRLRALVMSEVVFLIRVKITQGITGINFRDLDYYRLSDIYAKGHP